MNGSGREILATIQCVLSQVNKFVEMFLRSGELVRNQVVSNARLAIHEASGVHLRTHNRQPVKNRLQLYLKKI